MTSPVFTPLQMFFNTSGAPLTDGYLYIGTASQNPQTNPIAVYWDAAGTIPAAQPIRTSGGYPVRNGSPATVFVLATDFSLIVRDKSSSLVFSRLSGNAFSAEWVTYTPAGTGAVATTVQAKLRESMSVKDFGAVGDGVADDYAAIILARNAAIAGGKYLEFPAGIYKHSGVVNFASERLRVFGVGEVRNCLKHGLAFVCLALCAHICTHLGFILSGSVRPAQYLQALVYTAAQGCPTAKHCKAWSRATLWALGDFCSCSIAWSGHERERVCNALLYCSA